MLRGGQERGAPGEARWWKEQEGTGWALIVSELLVPAAGGPWSGAREEGGEGYGNVRKLGAGRLGRGQREPAGELSAGKGADGWRDAGEVGVSGKGEKGVPVCQPP